MREETLTDLEKLFLALADKTRLRLLGLMRDREVSVGSLMEQLSESQPKVSRHLAYLRSMGIVETRREGKRIYYRIALQTDVSITNILIATIGAIAAGGDQEQEKRVAATTDPLNETSIQAADGLTVSERIRVEELDVFLL